MRGVIDVREAVGLVRDGSTLLIAGSGAGHALPQRFEVIEPDAEIVKAKIRDAG